jgi:hypothetical protein
MERLNGMTQIVPHGLNFQDMHLTTLNIFLLPAVELRLTRTEAAAVLVAI